MKYNMKRIPFDVEIAKAIFWGEQEGQFVTRIGNHVEILTFNLRDDVGRTIAALVHLKCKEERLVYTYFDDGRTSKELESCFDLFIEVSDQIQFKNGDIVVSDNMPVGIFKKARSGEYDVYCWCCGKKEVIYGDTIYESASRLATDAEKQHLIDALKKDNSEIAKHFLHQFFGILQE